MTSSFNPRTVLRQTSNGLLAEMFSVLEIPIRLNWSELAKTDVDTIFAAYLALDDGYRQQAELMLHDLHSMVNEESQMVIFRQCHRAGEHVFLNELERCESRYDVALLTRIYTDDLQGLERLTGECRFATLAAHCGIAPVSIPNSRTVTWKPSMPIGLAPTIYHPIKRLFTAPEPWMQPEEIASLELLLDPMMHVLEFGSGRSTFWLAHRVAKVTTIEHNARWLERTKPFPPNVEVRFEPPAWPVRSHASFPRSRPMKLSDITFCIKTIHRPWSCHRLVESLCKHIAEPNNNIIVVDDGQPERRFLPAYPETAAKCQVIHPPQVDVGVGVGRNISVDAVTTEFMFLLDDDHVVTPNLNLDKLIDRFSKLDIDILGVRQGAGGRPTMLSPLMNGKRI
ncbi:glycosyltransferase [Neorhodopirellula pilleata]|uniref:Glycosyl transferase family 2 n=1 Tax=Neorhodopirellula pilleata TaxID=2714738 RepID=A0A5C5ZVU3_9BACT|nr:glycosyltransferase [Neorhodopirellula pilleata]TWT91694.1 Glycosyl transferase family 2 [Neorhodopirellula pilleata]